MKTLSLKVPDALDTRLTAVARRRATSKSAVVRDALERLATGDEAHPSALDLARDLAGCVAGPRDLSSNPKHLRGYGRDAARSR
jgi:predicted transcriptional regulator